MNELLQRHGCSNVFHVPEGLKELMADITREVLRAQPTCVVDFITDYLSALLITREHGLLSVKLLEDLCDCKPSVNEHLVQIGIDKDDAETLAGIIKETIEAFDIEEGKEKIKETELIKKILHICVLDTEMATKICHIARNAFRDYCYRKSLLSQEMKKTEATRPWELAAEHTLQIYKRTKPSFSDISRAAQKIQAAYRGYHVRRNILGHLHRHKKDGPKKEKPGPPADIADSREIDLGPCMELKVHTDDIDAMFDANEREKLNLTYDPDKVLPDYLEGTRSQRLQSRMMTAKSIKETTKQGAISIEMPHDEIKSPEAVTPAKVTDIHEMDENDMVFHYAQSTTTESILQMKKSDHGSKIIVPIDDKKPIKISISEGDTRSARSVIKTGSSFDKELNKKSSFADKGSDPELAKKKKQISISEEDPKITFSQTQNQDRSTEEKEHEFHQMIKHKLSIADAVKYKIIDDDDDYA